MERSSVTACRQWLELADVKVIAPVAAVDYSNPAQRVVRQPRADGGSAMDGSIEVLHPRWLFPPFGTPLNGLCMYLRLAPLTAKMRRRYPIRSDRRPFRISRWRGSGAGWPDGWGARSWSHCAATRWFSGAAPAHRLAMARALP